MRKTGFTGFWTALGMRLTMCYFSPGLVSNPPQPLAPLIPIAIHHEKYKEMKENSISTLPHPSTAGLQTV